MLSLQETIGTVYEYTYGAIRVEDSSKQYLEGIRVYFFRLYLYSILTEESFTMTEDSFILAKDRSILAPDSVILSEDSFILAKDRSILAAG
jgi:hypothetical protein